MGEANVIYTVGHGTRPIEEFIELLHWAEVARLVDVRRFPASRRHPHFSRGPLESSLGAAGIAYDWRGEELGGRREPSEGLSRHPAWRNDGFQAYADYMDSSAFQEALHELIAASATERVAIMCAETLWWRCHRRLISDALTMEDVRVMHLIDTGNTQEHKLHPNLRRDELGRPTYDVAVDLELFREEDA